VWFRPLGFFTGGPRSRWQRRHQSPSRFGCISLPAIVSTTRQRASPREIRAPTAPENWPFAQRSSACTPHVSTSLTLKATYLAPWPVLSAVGPRIADDVGDCGDRQGSDALLCGAAGSDGVGTRKERKCEIQGGPKRLPVQAEPLSSISVLVVFRGTFVCLTTTSALDRTCEVVRVERGSSCMLTGQRW
jgi:hypothetical protein